MIRAIAYKKSLLKVDQTYIGETIEQKMRRVLTTKEPIKDGAPIIYTERKNGVQPQYNIRTDRWEIAVDAMDKVDKSYKAKREERMKTMGEKAQEGMQKEGNSGDPKP